MAKNNNLTDYLTDVANAIREKKGTTDPINPQDFSAEIASIETGGGGGGAAASAEGDVNFRDYDGTILHSYSKDDFLALSALPELPTQPGLICQEWNYTFEDAQSYVAENGKLDVGATYITDDGKTRLYITIAAEGRMTIPLKIQQSVVNGVVVDWGDGSATETFDSTSDTTLSHTYSNIGDYVITLDVLDGTLTFVGASSYGFIASSMRAYSNMLQKVEIGAGVTSIGNSTFLNCYSLASVVIPNSVTSIGENAFASCSSLASVVIPNKVTSIGNMAFSSCTSLASVVIPNSVRSLGTTAFGYCYSLASVVIPNSVTTLNGVFKYGYSLASVAIPNSVTSIGESAFSYCYPLASVAIPNSVTSIGNSAFSSCPSLASVVIPNSVTSIGSGAFSSCSSLASVVIPNKVTTLNGVFGSCYSLTSVVFSKGFLTIKENAFSSCSSLAILDFRNLTSRPSLYSASYIPSVGDLKIIVPDSLYDEWKSATNWSSHASKIVKASEFNG